MPRLSRRWIPLVVLAGLAVAGASPSGQGPGTPLPSVPGTPMPGARTSARGQDWFKSGVDLVALDVCVKDRDGRFVESLMPEDFVVLEDDALQQVALFVPDGQVPLAVAVLVDRSSSMTGERLTRAKAAAAAFIRALRPDDLVEVLAFNERVHRAVALGRDHDAAESAVSALTADGSTGLFEAIAVALGDLTRARLPVDEYRRTIVVLSDGEDTSSRLAFEDVLEDARKSGAIIYAVSLRTDMKDRWLAAPYHLSQLAYDTGGRPIAVRNLESLTSIYEEIAAELRHLYRLGYVPAQAVRDGRWHAISVRVRRPDARIRTRTGYYAPRPASVVAKGGIR